jgi:hypothetical protein
VRAGEALEIVRVGGEVHGLRRLGPFAWERNVLRATAPDDVEGLRLSGLGSGRERIEAAFRHRFRDRDCKLLEVKVWPAPGRSGLTLGQIDFTCGGAAEQGEMLKKDPDGWGG